MGVDLEDYVARPDRISGADINAIVQEAGMQAVRENRYIVLPKDFEKGYKNNIKKENKLKLKLLETKRNYHTSIEHTTVNDPVEKLCLYCLHKVWPIFFCFKVI